MQFKEEWFVDQQTCLDLFKDKNIIVFGAGQDGRKFANMYGQQLNIRYFVDNVVNIDGTACVNDVYISYNPVVLDEDLSEDEIILICSDNYYAEIFEQLSKIGYIPGVDFYIWADFVADENIERLIEHNKKIWFDYRGDNAHNEVLVLYTEFHCGHTIIWSYYANILAKIYNAKIFAYMSKPSYKPLEPRKRLYRSFNVVDVIEYNLTDVQRKRRREIYEKISSNVKNKEDLLNININKKNYGVYIYALYLRNISPIFDYEKYKNAISNIIFDCITLVIFWDDYFNAHSVKAMVMDDAISYEGVIREVALKHGVKVYSAYQAQCLRCYPDYYVCSNYGINYKEEFKKLPIESQREGIIWAKKRIDNRLKGDISDIPYMGSIVAFGQINSCKLIKESNRVKVVICPHCFTDDPFPYGKFLFRDQYEWLTYLGELSNTTNYDWYLKIHPSSEAASRDVYDSILDKYTNIKALPLEASAVQLKAEGIDFALTLWGTLGHEYAALGINVINGGNGPHKDFNFNYNPKTFDEYDGLLRHLECLDRGICVEEIYEFYCMYYLYMRPLCMSKSDIFYPKEKLYSIECSQSYHVVYNKDGMPFCVLDSAGTGEYKIFLDQWKYDRHDEILNGVKEYLDKADALYNNLMNQ